MELDWKVEAEFLAAALRTKLIDSEVLKAVDPGFFSVESYSWLVKQLKLRSWKPIPFEYLDQLLLDLINDEEQRTTYRNQLYHLYTKELTFVEDAKKKLIAFIALSSMKAVIKQSFDSFEKSNRVDYLLKSVHDGYIQANGLIADKKISIIDYANHYEARMDRRKAERDNPSVNPVVLTGIPGLDQQFRIRAPMIVDFLAPFKRYKSIVLNSMGFASLLQGYNVLHVVYENTVELTENRYDALFGEISYDRISTLAISQDEKQRLDLMFSQIKTWGSRLKILKCQPTETTILDIEEEIDRLKEREGFVPDVIVLDYLNIVCPSTQVREERLQQQRIVWDVKHMADFYNVPVFTATQANMDAIKVERLTMAHRGKSVDISQGVNISIALDQTKEESEEGILVMSPHFSRDFKITIPEIVLDTDIEKMTIYRKLNDLWAIAKTVHGYVS